MFIESFWKLSFSSYNLIISLFSKNPLFARNGLMKVQTFLLAVIPHFATFLSKDFMLLSSERDTQVSFSFINCYVYYDRIFMFFLLFNLLLVKLGFWNSLVIKGAWFRRTVLFFKGACLFTKVIKVFLKDW